MAHGFFLKFEGRGFSDQMSKPLKSFDTAHHDHIIKSKKIHLLLLTGGWGYKLKQ